MGCDEAAVVRSARPDGKKVDDMIKMILKICFS
jgi:hypothetical protein